MSSVDPHSFTDSSEPFSTHIALNLFLDFSSSTIIGSALISLPTSYSGNLTLDSRAISISSVIDPDSLSTLPFAISSSADPIKGSPITITLSSHSSVLIVFSTSPSSSALQWLSPAQTSSGSHPFVYTQCQSIHARSVFPCQDTPAARIRYSARINLPLPLSAVMSASKLARRDPIAGEGSPGVPDSLWCSKDRIVECFSMDQPIPPYLFALAAGEISGRDLGPRTRVYAEGGSEVLDAAAREFSGVEEMVRVGEALFGPYEWERFDVLVLPPSFPYGGMENPRMVFLTPTVIKGDATGAQVVIHELAHSWTGNLITNKTNEDFWLNEIGRPAFDEFLKKYIATFKFQSIDTETFIEFLKATLPGIENQINLQIWIEGTGIPPDAMEPESAIYTKLLSLAQEFKLGKMPSEDEVADWNGQQWELYLENLPNSVEASQVAALDARYRLSESQDWEVKVAFLKLAISAGCKEYFGEVERSVKQVGRMKYLRPLYTTLVEGHAKEEEKMLAKRIFAEAREFYHPIARGVVESIFSKHIC
ncbi:hypothetical protein KFK09_006685 [Dendrobium nobile]|uniref:Peptidase M1 leukotriene A4 hydrolase/aminopeptidase C-terminal domain-containing protein n=1 Tax=Dendrobium nobile TaxID=94219 RepID=A0A8T3BUR2_DENNO|nr:hypothetical protein KFK09_006685 [Dendrobium nobile]